VPARKEITGPSFLRDASSKRNGLSLTRLKKEEPAIMSATEKNDQREKIKVRWGKGWSGGQERAVYLHVGIWN